jgi:UDP:flavonoid glycosyltransferase YjiC (YdhE family)
MNAFLETQFQQRFEATAEGCRGADVLVGAGLQLAAPSVAELWGIPRVHIAYTPNMLPSPRHTPPLVHVALPPILNRLMWRVMRLVFQIMGKGKINRGRARLGLAKIHDVTEHLYAGTILLATDPVVAPRDPDWPERWSQGSYIYFDDPAPLDPDLDAWLRAGEPPVYVGFGSMSTADTARVNREVIEAVKRTGRRGLLGAGWAGLGAEGLPDGWRVIPDGGNAVRPGGAPHALLFPRCAAVVHHGGSGTTAQALRAGVPQVLVPHVVDQFYFAHRLQACGLAPPWFPVSRLRADRLARALQTAMANFQDVRRSTSERLRASDGAGEAVRCIEAEVARAATRKPRSNATAAA